MRMENNEPALQCLLQRRWWKRLDPFPHFVAYNVFFRPFYLALEEELRKVLSRGLSDVLDNKRFSRNMPYSDAYGWNFYPDINGPFALFYSREWHNMLSSLTGVKATGDVNGALHHHHVGSKNGSIHHDFSFGWFSTQKRPNGINPMDLARCSYTHGRVPQPEIRARKTVRAVTMIFYFGNPTWTPGSGGETGLYRSRNTPVEKPDVLVPPINNSILVFENTPTAFHSFISNHSNTRNSIILWLHRTEEDAVSRWGENSISTW